jgi:hypothetical protein
VNSFGGWSPLPFKRTRRSLEVKSVEIREL